jgi:hypothetical protein
MSTQKGGRKFELVTFTLLEIELALEDYLDFFFFFFFLSKRGGRGDQCRFSPLGVTIGAPLAVECSV